MLYLVARSPGNETRRCYALRTRELRVGRDPGNDIVLESPLVSGRQATIRRSDGVWVIRSEGLNPIWLNGRALAAGESTPLAAGDRLLVAGQAFEVCAEENVAEELDEAELRARLNDVVLRVHDELVAGTWRQRMHDKDPSSTESRWEIVGRLDELLAATPLLEDPALRRLAAREAVRGRLIDHVLRRGREGTEGHLADLHSWTPEAGLEQEVERLVLDMEGALGLGVKQLSTGAALEIVRDRFGDAYQVVVEKVTPVLEEYLARRYVRREVINLTFGLGPIEDLLAIPSVNEIMVVSHDQIYIETGGALQRTSRTFGTEEVSRRVIERIVSRVGRRVDQSNPMVDARLEDGSRVNVVIPPVALKGCALTIRRFSRRPMTIDDLVQRGTLTARAANFLRGCVRGRMNIVISGGTGSGKTTLLNAISAFIDEAERVVTIEDNAELQLQQEHVVALEARMSNVEGRGEISIRDLVRNALRMRPDRIIVGECRGGEAFDMLQAMNTGHDGSLTTAHANSPADLVRRLESMVLTAVELPVQAIRRQIAAAIDVVVQVQRTADGQRIVTSIAEMVGLDEETGNVILENVFLREPGDPELFFTGYVPTFAETLVRSGRLTVEEMLA